MSLENVIFFLLQYRLINMSPSFTDLPHLFHYGSVLDILLSAAPSWIYGAPLDAINTYPLIYAIYIFTCALALTITHIDSPWVRSFLL